MTVVGKAALTPPKINFRFAPINRHHPTGVGRPFGAHKQKSVPDFTVFDSGWKAASRLARVTAGR
jgi:hypothetical protein